MQEFVSVMFQTFGTGLWGTIMLIVSGLLGLIILGFVGLGVMIISKYLLRGFVSNYTEIKTTIDNVKDPDGQYIVKQRALLMKQIKDETHRPQLEYFQTENPSSSDFITLKKD